MASSLYESTPGTTNANRVYRAVLGPCTDGLRDTLCYYVPPLKFPNVIKQNKLNLPRLTAVQRDLILPRHGNYTGCYDDVDISLLYILLKNISGISPHSKGWGKDPDHRDTSLSANIERIRLVRNRCVHSSDPSMSNTDFNSIWSTIRSVMVDLDAFLVNGNKYENKVDFLRYESMDPERDLQYEEELRKQVEEDTKTREMVVNLKKETAEETRRLDGRIEDTSERVEKLDDKMEKLTKSPIIPPNVREQYDIDIQKWREEDMLYYETHSFLSVMQKVRNQTYVTFVGVPGSGKSATAHHIALKLQEEGYEVVPVDEIREIKQYCDTKNPQVFVIDDVVGVFGLQKTKLDMLIDYGQKITQPCMVRSRTLMTCREAVFNETLPYKSLLTKEENVIRLHSSDNALDDKDKKQILKKYGLDVDLMSPALLKSTSHMFPLLCKLFSKETKFQALGSKFFLSPVQCIIHELDDMQRHNKLNYATLVLCMLNENSLSNNILKDKHFIDVKMNVLENCRLEHYTDTFKFMDALSAMEGTYTKQCGAKYTFIHDTMFEICAYQYGKQFPDQMLLYMNSDYIANYLKPEASEPGSFNKMKGKQRDSQSRKASEGSNDSEGQENESDDKNDEREESFDLCIRLCEDQYPLLAERFYRDIQNMELYDVFRNRVLKHPQVCQAFIDVLETKSYTELKSLFLFSQGEVDKIVSKQKCVEEESEERREWGEWVRQGLLVDQRNKLDDKGKILDSKYTNNVRVISWMIYYGHYQIIEYIVQQTMQHNEISELFRITGNSPNQSKSRIFKKIQNMTPNRKQKKVEKYRLLVLSCCSGDVQTVRLLLPICKKTINGIGQISEDIHWYTYSPLPLTCAVGTVSIVKELVKSGAGVNLQDKWGNTPLMIACDRGHASVVEELVKAGADVNLHDMWGENIPLMFACDGGHVRVVEELVKAGADVNIQDADGNTPLIAAIREGSLSTVKWLVEYGVDWVTQVVDINVSLIYIALIRNKPDIVKFLIQEQNKISPGKLNGNVHLFNCLVDIRHARVKTDSKDDVVVTDRSVWCMGRLGRLWTTIIAGDCDVLSHLLCVGLDVNQWIQLYDYRGKSNVRPLLYTLIDEEYVVNQVDKVRIMLGAGADVNVRVRHKEYDSVLDREGMSVLERTRQLVCKYSDGKGVWVRNKVPGYRKIMCEVNKHVRRYSV
ncbi:uncharacterized protein LOC125653783 isoform X2 [Ostrea edulis]|uniref:uncharacterized protein LOC125653783 isoform X2 n=1 Tax=Ostrea edulis TaxID=37623 RepID=UPI0024AFB28B|nr:uncharacterized protein LOC125653783 isoform X2 [Ostrea edulis]